MSLKIRWYLAAPSMFCLFRLKESGTDISFHPEQNLLTVGNIQGEISVFRVENEVGI